MVDNSTTYEKGTLGGYEYCLGQPNILWVAYVRLKDDSPMCGKHYGDIHISVHGGLNYSGTDAKVISELGLAGFWIGWNYGHYDDEMSYKDFPELVTPGTPVTKERIMADIASVITQLKTIERAG
jgi:hypothetical protein